MDYAASLLEPSTTSPIARSAGWIESVATGSLASVIAVIAVAIVGMMMLSGRLEVRRGITVVAGCFLVFGANVIARGIIGGIGHGVAETSIAAEPAPSALVDAPRPPPQPYDPYAGASVPH
jgi:type IV secretory pathway VirB2 component (pilin)